MKNINLNNINFEIISPKKNEIIVLRYPSLKYSFNEVKAIHEYVGNYINAPILTIVDDIELKVEDIDSTIKYLQEQKDDILHGRKRSS